MTAACPCGSGTSYDGCCGPLHRGEAAPSAVALMRSRFSAFALGLDRYLLDTWHPSTRPATVEFDPAIEWRKLQIVDSAAGSALDEDGVVEFRAAFRDRGRAGLLHERSRFRRSEGRWQYLDGDIRET